MFSLVLSKVFKERAVIAGLYAKNLHCLVLFNCNSSYISILITLEGNHLFNSN